MLSGRKSVWNWYCHLIEYYTTHEIISMKTVVIWKSACNTMLSKREAKRKSKEHPVNFKLNSYVQKENRINSQ